jgi:hypothetical protein
MPHSRGMEAEPRGERDDEDIRLDQRLGVKLDVGR